MKKTFLLLMMCITAVILNAQVYTEYFDVKKSDGTALSTGDAIETGDALTQNYNGWYLSAKSSNREVGAGGETSPLVTAEDALFFGDYKGSEKGKVVKLDSAVAYVSNQRDDFWAINDGAGDTLKLDSTIGVVYTAFLVVPMANSKNSYRDFFGYEFSLDQNTSRGRVFMNYQNGDVIFGVSRNTTSVSSGLDTITIKNAVDQTFLMVMKYEMGDPTIEKDDTVKLYIDPNPLLTEAEQTGIMLVSKDAQNDQSHGDIVRLRIRQKGMNALIGGIRVANSWYGALVGEAVTGVSLDKDSLSLETGTNGTLVATVTPEDATDPSVVWSSSNEAVATVTNGVVTAVADGEANIIVTTTVGALTDTCVVTVTHTVGVSNSEVDGFNLYPNPVSDGVVYVKLSDTNKVKSIEIYNVLGILVHSEKVGNRSLVEINTADMLTQGVYFVKINDMNGSHIEQVIVK